MNQGLQLPGDIAQRLVAAQQLQGQIQSQHMATSRVVFADLLGRKLNDDIRSVNEEVTITDEAIQSCLAIAIRAADAHAEHYFPMLKEAKAQRAKSAELAKELDGYQHPTASELHPK